MNGNEILGTGTTDVYASDLKEPLKSLYLSATAEPSLGEEIRLARARLREAIQAHQADGGDTAVKSARVDRRLEVLVKLIQMELRIETAAAGGGSTGLEEIMRRAREEQTRSEEEWVDYSAEG